MNKNKLLTPSLSLLAILCSSAIAVNATERPAGLTDADIKYVKELISEEVKSNQEATDDFDFNGYFRTGTNTVIGGGAKNGGSC